MESRDLVSGGVSGAPLPVVPLINESDHRARGGEGRRRRRRSRYRRTCLHISLLESSVSRSPQLGEGHRYQKSIPNLESIPYVEFPI